MSNSTQGPIEWFRLNGLHGYKDIEIDFTGKATVIVAENGTGKTTVLNALNALITRRLHRLSSINFHSIECKFRDSMFPLTITKSHIKNAEGDAVNMLKHLATSGSVPETVLTDFIQNTYVPGDGEKLRNHPVFRSLYVNTSHDHVSLEAALTALHADLDNSLTDDAKLVISEVRQYMEGVEVVYLPTYRRIERPLIRESRIKRRPGIRQDLSWSEPEYDDMAFGLSDVQQRLAKLSEDIERRSNLEYRALSTRMLDEMLQGLDDREAVSINELPDTDSLARFLNRVGHSSGRRDNLFGDISSLYESGRIESSQNWLLRYFLSRLATVINQTRETELIIEKFVSVCNSYLTLSNDEKSLSFDPQTLRVIVQNQWANCQISLDDLSSGEKQIVSLMAHLYLNRKSKIVLVDEPELSLSIDWQRKVLPDIVNSETVLQTLAITHSPFVFDNELDHCARPLKVTRFEGS